MPETPPPADCPLPVGGFADLLSPQSVAEFGGQIIGHRDHWLRSIDQFSQSLPAHESLEEPILITASDPVTYVAQCLTALAHGHSAVCGSPDWTAPQREALSAQWPRLIKFSKRGPVPIIQRGPVPIIQRGPVPIFVDGPLLYLSTGGTGGRLKFARHTGHSIMAAIRSLSSFLEQDCLSTVAILRPFHTGGMMPWLRAFFTGGQVLPAAAGSLAENSLQPPEQALLSLVPAQLYDFLKAGDANWSSGLKAILLGGAPAGEELLQRATGLGLPLMPCYGMTETAGLVAAQRPGEWHPNSSPAGHLLPGNSAEIDANGQILLRSEALFVGYGDEQQRYITQWPTGDRGQIDSEGRLVISGRVRPWINSGGKKVAPALVEAALCQTFPEREARVIPLPDPKWGEVVAVVMSGPPIDIDTLRNSLRNALPVEGLPRVLKCVDAMPVDERGKTTEQALRALLADQR